MKFAELRPILLGMAGVLAITSVAAGQTPKSASASPVSFTKDVAPILQRSCQKCHRPGSIAPMTLPRPPDRLTPPRTTAVTAVSDMVVPCVGSPDAMRAV